MLKLTILLLLVATTAPAETVCEWMRSFKTPQPIYYSTEDPLPLQITHVPSQPTTAHSTPAPSGNYSYFVVETETESFIQVARGGQTGLRLSVKEYRDRPITATWINAKLLLVEVSINPHVGVYWILDAETEKVVLSEIENDGTVAWAQCRQPGAG